MRSRCKSRTNLLREFDERSVFRQIAVSVACLGFFSISLPLAASANSFAVDASNILICDNSSYDGATLPSPTKKKAATPAAPSSTSAASAEDTDSNGAKKHRKKLADGGDSSSPSSSSDSMNPGDTTNGATLPPARKANRLNGAGPQGGDHEGRFMGDKKGGGHDMFGKGPLDLTALSLTDEQKQKIAQMHAENGTKMRDLMRKRRDLSTQMKDVMFDADVNEAQIRAKRDEVRQVQEKLEDLRLNDFLAIRALLTPEQRLKLKDVKIANNRPHEGDAPAGPGAKRDSADSKDGKDAKKLADSPK